MGYMDEAADEKINVLLPSWLFSNFFFLCNKTGDCIHIDNISCGRLMSWDDIVLFLLSHAIRWNSVDGVFSDSRRRLNVIFFKCNEIPHFYHYGVFRCSLGALGEIFNYRNDFFTFTNRYQVSYTFITSTFTSNRTNVMKLYFQTT